MDCSWAWRRWCFSFKNQFSWSSLHKCVSENSFKKIHEQAKVCIYEVQDCDPDFCLTPFSQYPEFHCLTATGLKATSRFIIPKQFVHFCKYPDCLNCMLGGCHPHVPAGPWCCWCPAALLPYLELCSHTELPRVCRKTQCWPMQTNAIHRHKSIYSILPISHVTRTIIFPLS